MGISCSVGDGHHIMEWNVNQRLDFSKKDMPVWIADVIKEKEKKADIVILTELFKERNWPEVKTRAFGTDYYVFESQNQGEQNDVAIAISKFKLDVIYAKTYFSSDHSASDHSAPDHLEVMCRVKGTDKEFLVVGMRVHAMITDEKKEKELKLVLDAIKDEKVVIIGGDFNNNRRGYDAPERWHIKRLDEIISCYGFKRKTPDGSSIYQESKSVDVKDNKSTEKYEFAEDHFLIKGIESDNFNLNPYDRAFCAKDRGVYKWRNDFNNYNDKKGSDVLQSVAPPYPDHAILSADFKL
jgi:endonuclease/exonuclease/phosphatase family metal-dependent hydrolase